MWLSVIISVYQDDKSLKKLLAELKQWDLSKIEIIIIDGEKRSRPRWIDKSFIYLTSDISRGKQLHLGGSVAKGSNLLFLHSDSHFPQGSPIDILKKTSNKIGFFKLRFDRNNQFYKIMEFGTEMRSKIGKLIFGDQGLFIKKYIYDSLGGFPEIDIMEDYKFSKLLKKNNYHAQEFDFIIVTSSRKYEKEGHLKSFCKMQVYKMAFQLGVSPKIIKQMYYRGK